MHSLYNQTDTTGILERIDKLAPGSPARWGKMNAPQMLAHCNMAMDTALGKTHIKRLFIGRLIGGLVKRSVLGEKPFSRNSPTDKSYIITGHPDFEKEKAKLVTAIREFSTGGPRACTTHPHPFFGHFTPEQWAVFQWKHFDHHLRQFGV